MGKADGEFACERWSGRKGSALYEKRLPLLIVNLAVQCYMAERDSVRFGDEERPP